MRHAVGLLACVACALGLSACFAGRAGVGTNVISAADPSAFHTAGDTGVTSVAPAVFDAGCAQKIGTSDVLECKWFFRVRLNGAQNIDTVVPAGAFTDPKAAVPANATGVGPTPSFASIQSGTQLHLQPWTDYQTQGCGWVRTSNAPSTWIGPFCGGKDTNGDGQVDINTWSDPWSTQPDPSGFNPTRYNGMPLHWAGTGERVVDFGNCTTNAAYATGIARIPQWSVAGQYRSQLTTCDSAAQDVRVSDANQGDNGILGFASWRYLLATAHIVTTAPSKPTISLNSFYAGGSANRNTEVVIHESGHIAGLAHRRGTVMNAVGFGTFTAADAPNLATIGFLYGHADSAAAAASSPAAAVAAATPASAAGVRDPALRRLLQRGAGARSVRRTGRAETELSVNRGNGVIAVANVIYASESAAARDVERQAVDVAAP